MEEKLTCQCCRREEATIKDYRYIDSIGCQGKILVCKNCFNLDDIHFVEEYCKEA